MNDNVKCSEARRLAQDFANFYRENIYPLPLDFPFPGLRVRITAEQIVSEEDTQPMKVVRDENVD